MSKVREDYYLFENKIKNELPRELKNIPSKFIKELEQQKMELINGIQKVLDYCENKGRMTVIIEMLTDGIKKYKSQKGN